MKKVIICIVIFFFSPLSFASAVYWTVKAEGGIMYTAAGTATINIRHYQPFGPNPSGTEWLDCKDNWIYFHRNAAGEWHDQNHVNAMLGIALAAYKTASQIRVRVERDSLNRCYTNQIYDQG